MKKDITNLPEYIKELEIKAEKFDKLTAIFNSSTMGLKAKAVVQKQDKPEKDSPAYAMYELLSKAKEPMQIEAIAKHLKISVAYVKKFKFDYTCFENIRKKGYILKKD